jgi:hypothetical protein
VQGVGSEEVEFGQAVIFCGLRHGLVGTMMLAAVALRTAPIPGAEGLG